MLPILPLKTVLIPDMTLTVYLADKRYQLLLNRCIENDGELAIVFCSDYNNEATSLGKMGCKARIEKCEVMPDGQLKVSLLGLNRFSFSEISPKLNIYYAENIQYVQDTVDIAHADPLLSSVFKVYQKYISTLVKFDPEIIPETPFACLQTNDSLPLLNSLALPALKRQKGLEILSARERFVFILSCLRLELNMLSFVSLKEAALPTYKTTLN